MAINQILPFGTAAGANVLAPADYQALASRNAGFSAGTAKSKELNTVWRQASFVAAMLGQYIADKSGQDVLDNGDLAALQAKFVAALAASPAFTGTPTAPTPGQGDNSTKIATTAFVARVLGSYPMMVSIAAVPTYNAGPLMIAEAGEMWLWTSTAFYTGYRSPLCGRPLLGHTPSPFVNEIDATGGLLSKAAYPALWGYAQEAGLVVSQAVWAANIGAHYFVDVNSTQFRVPDLRDMHFRHTGTNADGGARALGTKQLDASQRLQGVLGATQEIGVGGVFAALPGTTTQFAASPTSAQSFTQVQMDTVRTSRVSSETRGINVAFHPRIHI
ncbi:hypothetical protein KDH83_13320 [Achromobacter sp. Marseille-Q0513]|uniref:hypothetical protein n=1 Tax=Achromobacter sp. Marseille-Q0513 TaxID=2829161 RepID=UPI001B99F170|nr:hypothetical protein [Achromobacter sp. Marseille-Q0513]MBR8654276.1 hypothetical protein [Achromobacter sp. Marseille-Q0513]